MKSISAVLCFVALITPGLSQVSLGTAAPFGVLASGGITNTGKTVVTGNIGTSGREITGFPPGKFNGTSGIGSKVSAARADALSAYTTAQGLTGATALAGIVGSGQTVTAGIYSFQRSAEIEGVLTLSGPGTFVFQIPSTLVTFAGSSVVVADGANASDVFWTAASTATLAADTTFSGNVLSDSSITVGSKVNITGSLHSGDTITLDDDIITV